MQEDLDSRIRARLKKIINQQLGADYFLKELDSTDAADFPAQYEEAEIEDLVMDYLSRIYVEVVPLKPDEIGGYLDDSEALTTYDGGM